jgi:FkbM family methyltransferase
MRFSKIKTLYSRLDLVTFLKYISADAVRRLFLPASRFFFAQGGEDIHILYLLDNKPDGFYLDIGANQPIRYSNTFKLYLTGWTGILVDANPHLIKKAAEIRKKDICVHALVSNEHRNMDFYISELDLFSSIHSEYAESGDRPDLKLEKIELQTVSIDQIIEKYVPAGKPIDLLSIDVEGHDFEVLQSLSLLKYRPRLIVIEDLYYHKTKPADNKYTQYMSGFNYTLTGADKQNLYFIRNEEYNY